MRTGTKQIKERVITNVTLVKREQGGLTTLDKKPER